MACAALELLGAIGPGAADAIQALVRMTDNPDMDVRRSASAALVTIAPDGKGLGPALLAAIYNADPSAVDRLAATMRGAPNNRAILAKIIDLAANDPDAPVRATADRALKNLSPDATPAAATQPAGG
jgi:HEAT repeat protein